MSKTASKKTIVIDIDEVLASNAAGFVEFSNRRWGTNLKVEDYNEHWAQLWQADELETERRAVEYHLSGTIQRLEAMNEARQVLIKLSKNYRLVVLTSRRKIVEKETRDWVNANFPRVFSDIHFAGIWDKVARDRMNMTKADQLKQLKADYFIDDQPKHCFSAAEAGIDSLLFGDYPWNEGLGLPRGVTRAKNWQEVKDYFDAKSR